MMSRNALAIIILAVAVLYWLSLPPDRVAFDEACAPVDLQARLSAAVYGPRFWQAQQAAAAAMIGQLAALPAATEHANEETRASMNATEQRMTRLSMQDGSDDERQLAAEQRARLEKMAWLQQCHDAMAARVP